VAQADVMSGGRVELGLGAGWYDEEHRAYGIPFPPTKERFERLEEQLAIVTGLWDTPAGETFSYDGRHYTVTDSPALPKPARRPPVIVGGSGPKTTPRLAATYADEFNLPFSPLADFVAQRERVTAACEAIGRDPATMIWSAALVVCCGDDEATFRRRAAAIDREPDEVRVPLAVAEAIAPGGSAVIGWGSKPGILIRRDNGDLVGFKGVCTHLDCNVTWKPDTRRFYCPCHQGWFDAEGRNIQGPPPRPLTPFILAVEGAELVVRTTPKPPEGGAA
jgi:alkanesulfonate monooxygenase SsuD/methylene tetrahydromethanopterin reductase-like flavin-dependent oxidoreductase (luciferase family)